MQITEAESHVMEALWRKSALTADEIILEVVSQNWGPATVKTLINRLLKKSLISGGRVGERYEYSAVVQRADYALAESQSLLDRLFDGQLTPLVAHFAQHRKLKRKDIARLKALIEKLDK